jgi:hypothetical protein
VTAEQLAKSAEAFTRMVRDANLDRAKVIRHRLAIELDGESVVDCLAALIALLTSFVAKLPGSNFRAAAICGIARILAQCVGIELHLEQITTRH